MAKPNHFVRPVQPCGRSSVDYGHTRLVSDGKVYPRELVREILGGLAVLVLGLAFLAGLWIITP